MNYSYIKRVMLVILCFLLIMVLISYGINKGEVQVEEEDIDVVEGDYFDENSLYIINETDVYDYFDTYENAGICIKKVSDELTRYGSNLKVAKLDNIECSDNVLVFNIVNADLENNVTDAFKITVSKEGTAIERLS